MPPRACLSPRPGVRRRKDDSERAVWRSGRPSRPARIRPNPPNPGQMARFPGKTPLQSAVEAVRIPSPYLHPSGKPAPDRPSNTPPKVPSLDEDPLEPLDFKPVTRPPAPLWTSAPLPGDRHAPESVIGMAELVIGIGGIRRGGRRPVRSGDRGVRMRSWGGRGAGRFHDFVKRTLQLVKRRLHCEPFRRFSDSPGGSPSFFTRWDRRRTLARTR